MQISKNKLKERMRMIIVNEQEKVFHLNNGRISYLFYVMESGQLGHCLLYTSDAADDNVRG